MRHATRGLLLLVGAVLVSSPAWSQEAEAPPVRGSTDTSTPEYRIGPEDVLFISVWQNAELTRSVPVRPDGRISLPLVKEIPAANRTPAELGADIEARLKAYMTTAIVSVVVAEVNSYRVSIVGKVQKPGRYNFRSPTSVLEALAAAGGLQEYVKGDDILVLRSGPSPRPGSRPTRDYIRLKFDYPLAIKAAGPAAVNFDVQPNDIIVVP
jgi:polysaccharide export outer membrane protein